MLTQPLDDEIKERLKEIERYKTFYGDAYHDDYNWLFAYHENGNPIEPER